MSKTKAIKLPPSRPVPAPTNGKPKIRLDLSFGIILPQIASGGFVRKNFTEGIWPVESESVEEVFSAFSLNRIPGEKRPAWMDELWRVLIPEGKATIVVPYWASPRSIQDPFSKPPAFCEQSFLYFNRKWRESNNHSNYCKCNFDFTYGYNFDPETSSRSEETRAFWIKHYVNAIQDLQVVLTKLP